MIQTDQQHNTQQETQHPLSSDEQQHARRGEVRIEETTTVETPTILSGNNNNHNNHAANFCCNLPRLIDYHSTAQFKSLPFCLVERIIIAVMNAAISIFGLGVGVGLVLGDSFRGRSTTIAVAVRSTAQQGGVGDHLFPPANQHATTSGPPSCAAARSRGGRSSATVSGHASSSLPPTTAATSPSPSYSGSSRHAAESSPLPAQ